jgi:hypothetical protein
MLLGTKREETPTTSSSEQQKAARQKEICCFKRYFISGNSVWKLSNVRGAVLNDEAVVLYLGPENIFKHCWRLTALLRKRISAVPLSLGFPT